VDHPADELLGRVIRNNIEILSILGVGAMGTVYLARETHLDRKVAVKVLNHVTQEDPRTVEYFMREATVLSSLRHPNLAWVVDFGREEVGGLFLVMEYIPGRPLEAVIEQEGPLSIDRALRIATQIALALEEVHRRGVIHRDLKPGNVMIEDLAGMRDFVKIFDFGIADVTEKDRQFFGITETDEIGQAFGTPMYMAPEQALGDVVDSRADVYALGVILYEMLCGRPPFDAEDVVGLIVEKASAAARPPSERNPSADIPPLLDDVCLRAMERNPAHRYATVQELREELDKIDSLHRAGGVQALRVVTTLAQRRAGPVIRDEAVLAIMPTLSPSPDVGASREAMDIVWTLVREVVEGIGGVVAEADPSRCLVRFSSPEAVGALIHAAEGAVRFRQRALRRFPYIRFRMGIGLGALALDGRSGPLPGEQAMDLASRAFANQILFPGDQVGVLESLFVVTVGHRSGVLVGLRRRVDAGTSTLGSTTAAVGGESVAAACGLVGRQRERKRLDDIFFQIVDGGPGGAVLLTGPTGVGKSQMARYVRTLCGGFSLPVLEVYCHNRLLDRPFRPLLNVILQVAVPERYEAAVDASALDRGLRMAGVSASSRRTIVDQYFGAAPGKEGADEGPLTSAELFGAIRDSSPRDRGMSMRAALREVLRCLTRSGGVVVVIEDLHQADVGTAACLSALKEVSERHSLLVVATASVAPSAITSAGFEAMALEPLPEGDREEFWRGLSAVGQRSRRVAPPRPDAAALVRSEGLPLYLTRWWESPPEAGAPPDASALLALQAARLPGSVRRLLTVTSVLGEYFEVQVLEALFPDGSSPGPALEQAVAMGWLEACDLEMGLYRFPNPLMRNAIYQSIEAAPRAQFHRQVLERLERGAGGSLYRTLLLATHADRAGMGKAAMALCERVGDRFARDGDVRVAEYWYQRALVAATRASRQGESVDRTAHENLVLKTAHVLLLSGRNGAARTLLGRMAPAFADHAVQKTLLLSQSYFDDRNLEAATRAMTEGMSGVAGESPMIVALLELAARLKIVRNDYEGAVAVLRQTRDVMSARGFMLPAGFGHLRWTVEGLLGEAWVGARSPEAAEDVLQRALLHARAAGDGVGVARVIRAFASIMGGPTRARELLALASELLRDDALALRLPQETLVRYHTLRPLLALDRTSDAREVWSVCRGAVDEMGWLELMEALDQVLDEFPADGPSS